MIIFDLDGTLADCSHRRHFVDPSKNDNYFSHYDSSIDNGYYIHKETGRKFKPDYKSFYEACNKDVPIWPMVRVIESLGLNEVTLKDKEIQIWSGRCESVRGMTEHWLKYIIGNSTYSRLKMRPFGNTEPDEVLKERWLDGYLDSMYPRLEIPTKDGEVLHRKSRIEFVFDSHYESIKMWRRRGIFVFHCSQHEEEF